jgi:hypothetical protein
MAHGDVVAMYQRPEESEVYNPWVAALAAEFQRGDPAAYVGFLGEEGESRIREAYPKTTWDRLVEVKQRYDPTNLFRLNQNIPSAAPMDRDGESSPPQRMDQDRLERAES